MHKLALLICVLSAPGLPDAIAQDAPIVPPRYRDRFDGRTRLVGKEVGAAISRGLDWLRSHQEPDGRWDPKLFMRLEDEKSGPRCDGAGRVRYVVAVTGLAVLALLGDGLHEPGSAHASAIENGMAWLLRRQGPNGAFGDTKHPEYIYSQAIATLAVVEAAGLLENKAYRASANKALAFLEAHRNGKPGWAYEPTGVAPDVSVTSWCATAYSAAFEFGFDVDVKAFESVLAFVDGLTEGGRVGYSQHPGGRPARMTPEHDAKFPRKRSEGPTAAALMTRFWLGQSVRDQVVRDNAGIVYATRPSIEPSARDFYYWYYATYAMFQYGGQGWRNWRKEIESVLLELQNSDGHASGSWDANCCWGSQGGRVYATALGVLTLQAPYRLVRFSAIPGVPDGGTFDRCYAAWTKSRFRKVKGELDRLAKAKLDDRDRLLLARGVKAFEAASARADRDVGQLRRGGDDILAAQVRLGEIADQWAGLEIGKRAAKVLRSFKSDAKLRREIQAAKKLEKARARFAKTKDVLRYRIDLRAIAKSQQGTRAGMLAKDLLDELK